MPKSKTVLFKKSLIAAAVLSLSACSSTPRIDDYDLSRVGEGILTAGRTTADVSSRVWNKTTYLLGFSDEDTGTISDEGLLMDADDVALLDDESDTVVRPIVIRSAIPTTSQDQTPINGGLDTRIQTPTDSGQLEDADLAILPTTDLMQQTPTTEPLTVDTADSASLPKEDVIHEVLASETLWDIAKSTTGDANNWHALADTNNLGPSASVFPGQLLIIPADMVKSKYDIASDPSDALQGAASPYVDTQNLTVAPASNASEKITDPAASNTAITATDQQINGKPFKVNPGETLWDLAKRVTGDATNWQAIAFENDFTEKQASYVRAGQTIYVPETMIKPELEAAQALETGSDNAEIAKPVLEGITSQPDAMAPQKVMQNTEQEELAITVITSASAATRKTKEPNAVDTNIDLLSDSTSVLDETQPIKIIEATYKASKNPAAALTPPLVSEGTEELAAAGSNGQSPAEIMVSGTYYPKAVYNEADFSSSLLMRVSPGTTLQVSKPMGSWYQVKTSKGLGYVHQRDIR